jgi:hypothetical protein
MSGEQSAHFAQYTGTGANDNDVLLTTGNVGRFDAFTLMSTVGAVDVFVSLDGTTYSTAALSLSDHGATTSDPVLVTAALRVYQFRGKFAKVRVLQNGATGATAFLNCWNG